jgi:hypothetical protein
MADKANTFWRRMDWRLWSHAYMAETPETERIAWVRPCGPVRKADAPEPPADDPRAVAQVRDISLGGLVLVVNQRFDSGALLKIEVPSPATGASVTLLARVIQVLNQSPRTFVLSCCFAKELDEDDLRVFGAECIRPQEDDGRAWVRFSCDAEVEFHAVLGSEQAKSKAKVVNISAGGFAMQTSQKFEGGTLISVGLTGADGNDARPTLARVVHVATRPEGGWVLGCTFVTELSDNDLQALM